MMKTFIKALVLSAVCLTVGRGLHCSPSTEESHQKFREMKRLAKEGDAEAQYKLGITLLHGLNGFQGSVDEKEALKWLGEAAVGGHSGAQYYMGEIYQYGLAGVSSDRIQALEWYKRSAAQGHTLAQTMVKHLTEDKTKLSAPTIPSPSSSSSSSSTPSSTQKGPS